MWWSAWNLLDLIGNKRKLQQGKLKQKLLFSQPGSVTLSLVYNKRTFYLWKLYCPYHNFAVPTRKIYSNNTFSLERSLWIASDSKWFNETNICTKNRNFVWLISDLEYLQKLRWIYLWQYFNGFQLVVIVGKTFVIYVAGVVNQPLRSYSRCIVLIKQLINLD